jgi:hypothetical protein
MADTSPVLLLDLTAGYQVTLPSCKQWTCRLSTHRRTIEVFSGPNNLPHRPTGAPEPPITDRHEKLIGILARNSLSQTEHQHSARRIIPDNQTTSGRTPQTPMAPQRMGDRSNPKQSTKLIFLAPNMPGKTVFTTKEIAP